MGKILNNWSYLECYFTHRLITSIVTAFCDSQRRCPLVLIETYQYMYSLKLHVLDPMKLAIFHRCDIIPFLLSADDFDDTHLTCRYIFRYVDFLHIITIQNTLNQIMIPNQKQAPGLLKRQRKASFLSQKQILLLCFDHCRWRLASSHTKLKRWKMSIPRNLKTI